MTHTARAAISERIEVDAADRHDAEPVAAGLGVQLSLHQDLAAIESDWRAFEAEADGTAFQTFDWVAAWQRHIGVRDGVSPAIVIGRRRGRILFILPFVLQPGRLRRIVWLGAFLNSASAPLLARDFAGAVSPAQFPQLWREIERLLRAKTRYDLIDLDKIPETVGAQANPLLALALTRHASDTYVTRLEGTWDELYAAKRSSSWRKTDGKRRRRLEKFGDVAFTTAEEPAEITQTVDALIAQKKDLYASLGVPNLFEKPGYRDFHMELATKCRGLVHVSSVKVGLTIVAASFGLMFHGNYDYMLAGYATGELEACSPGTIHLQALMRHFLERGFKTFDFNIGDAPYKREWYDLELKLYDYAAPGSVQGWLAAAVTSGLRQLKGYVKRHPWLYPMVVKTRAAVGRLRA
jgi:CelD/BcsL family acetyltransferase involved in cellulose biosynthesis